VIDLTIRLDGDAKTQEALRKLASASGVALRDVCADNMRLWAAAAFRITSPASLRKARKSVRRQIAHTISAVKDEKIMGILRGWYKRGKLPGAVVDGWAMIDDMQKWHQGHRGKKNETVAKIGKMRVQTKLYTSPEVRERLFALIEKRIGRLKWNWMRPVEYWAAQSHGSGISGFGWLRGRTFESDHREGGVITRAGNGSIYSTNAVPYIGEHGNMPRDKMDAATRIRLADLERHALKRVDRLRAQFARG